MLNATLNQQHRAPLIVCADDYGQSAAIDEAILGLIVDQKLTATSCLSLSPRWPAAASALCAQHRQWADIGLHLDFTQYATQVCYPHPQLVWRALARRLPVAAVVRNIEQQLDAFEAALGTAPDYVDGHLHVHQLPQIREALMAVLLKRYGHLPTTERPWLRVSSPPAGSGFKAWVIHLLGARALMREAHRAGFAYSPVLLGVYDFSGDEAAYFQAWRTWAAACHAHHAKRFSLDAPAYRHALPPILMCHPAQPSPTVLAGAPLSDAPQDQDQDPIAAARVVEWSLMQSDAFSQWLADSGLQLVTGRGYLHA